MSWYRSTKALAHGTTILESSLHTNLVEHLNSEIGLKTITNVETAKVWLRSSFLYQRMQSNPNFYSLDTHIGSDQKTYQENVDDIIMKSITRLKKSQLVDHVENGPSSGKLSATPFGEIMSKVCLSTRLIFFSCYFFPFHRCIYVALQSVSHKFQCWPKFISRFRWTLF